MSAGYGPLRRSRPDQRRPTLPFRVARGQTSQSRNNRGGRIGNPSRPWGRFSSGEAQKGALARPVERQFLGRAQQPLHAQLRRLSAGQYVGNDVGRQNRRRTSAVARPLLFVMRSVISFSVLSVSARSFCRAATARWNLDEACVAHGLIRLPDDHTFALTGPPQFGGCRSIVRPASCPDAVDAPSACASRPTPIAMSIRSASSVTLVTTLATAPASPRVGSRPNSC